MNLNYFTYKHQRFLAFNDNDQYRFPARVALGYEYWLLLAVMNVKRRNFTRIEFPRNHRHNNETFRIDKLFTFQQLLRMYKYSWTAAMFK